MAVEHAVGTRKRAVAKVWLGAGDGKVEVNGKSIEDYLGRKDLVELAVRPLAITEVRSRFDVRIQVMGGGSAGQASAISLSLSRVLIKQDPALRKTLKDAGLLTRDSREKERMKYGQAKRRKSFQWTKR